MEDGKIREFEDSAKPQTSENYVYSKGSPDVEGKKTVDGVVLAEDAPLSVGVGKGNWMHTGWHAATAVCGPALLGLPYAMALLGWPTGVVVIMLGYFVTLWTTIIVADLVEFDGTRHLRYRDLAEAIFGVAWGRCIIWPCQWANLIGANISIFIQAGLSMQAIYQLAHPGDTGLKLWEFIVIMGVLALFMTQLPTLHSLRYFNGFGMLVTYTFSFLSIILAIYQGHKYDTPKDYGVHSQGADKVFGIFNGIVIMSFAYGNTLVPEIAAQAQPPLERTMHRGIGVLYVLLAFTYLPVAFVGYWAYGYALVENGASFLPIYFGAVGGPKVLIYIVLVTTLCNSVQGISLYSAPVEEWVETKIYRREDGIWGVRNWFLRTLIRCSFIAVLVLIAALFPYWGDILGLIGALGVTPIDFIYPFAMAIKLNTHHVAGWKRPVAWFLMILYGAIGIMGTIASVRGIVLDAKIYSVFANLGVLSPS